MNKGMLFSQGGYVKPVEKDRDVFPDVGDQFFWRVVSHGQSVSLELRQYRGKLGGKSWLYGVRGSFNPNAENLKNYANDLFLSLKRKQAAIKNAADWAGDYSSIREAGK